MTLVQRLLVGALFLLLWSASNVQSQDGCITSNQPNPASPGLLFTVTNDEEVEIWSFSFADNLALPTGFVIPSTASQIILDPLRSRIAYAIAEPNIQTVLLLDLNTGETTQIFTSLETDTHQLIAVRWIDESRIGFVSDGSNQEFVIIDLRSMSLHVETADVPILRRNVVGGSAFGDWDLDYSKDFSHAVLIDFRAPDEQIQLWDLAESQRIEIENLPPVSWIGPGRAYTWDPTGNTFWIREGLSKWHAIRVSTDEVVQVTDADSEVILQFPAIHAETDQTVFQAINHQLNPFVTSLALLRNGKLVSTCLETTNALYNTHTSGWSDDGRFFAFALIDHTSRSQVLILDTASLEFSTAYTIDSTQPRLEILGWFP